MPIAWTDALDDFSYKLGRIFVLGLRNSGP
jgi:hypothetical protein